MDEQIERFTRAMAVERVALGALLALAPRQALKIFGAPSDADTPALRYMARLFGVRNAMLGVMLWQARDDRPRLQQMATLNAATEAVDAVAASVPLLRRQGLDRAAVSALATSLSVMTAFLRLRAAAGSLLSTRP
jgi:nucleotidyltransferase/DNA polymerase involved in DNA repair